MDLYAYMSIHDLENVAKENNIEVPRLRGYNLCINMKPWLNDEIKNILNDISIECCRTLCESDPFWDVNCDMLLYDDLVKYRIKYYTDDESTVRWDRIHGRKRRILKTYIHNEQKKFLDFVKVWNKYCGRKDVLRVHSRIGGGNWPFYFKEVVDREWFIEKVDDWYDCTYCDIYAKLKEKE